MCILFLCYKTSHEYLVISVAVLKFCCALGISFCCVLGINNDVENISCENCEAPILCELQGTSCIMYLSHCNTLVIVGLTVFSM